MTVGEIHGRRRGVAGWRVDVRWQELRVQIKPKDHMELLSPFLPVKYSPLQPSGLGLQSVYLTKVPGSFADALVEQKIDSLRNDVSRDFAAQDLKITVKLGWMLFVGFGLTIAAMRLWV